MPRKRRIFDKFKDPEDDELERDLHGTDGRENISELLWWWMSQSKKFPHLSFPEKEILCIPGTNGSSERNFSAADFIFRERRTYLKPESLDSLLLLHENF